MRNRSATRRHSKSTARRNMLQHRRLTLESLEQRQLLTVVSVIPAKDNSIYSAFVNNSNGKGDLYIGLNNDGNNIKRALMAFDVAAAVPAGATINSVSLSMYCVRNANGGNATVELHKLSANWGEGTSMAGSYTKSGGKGTAATTNDATWNSAFYNTTAWATPGGSFSPTVSGSTLVNGPGGVGSYTWASTAQMVADVQSWLNNPGTNFGWMLKASAADELVNSSHAFYPREWTTASQRPTLTIDYTLAATNLPPTLNAISNPPSINENAGLQTVNLAGITAGGTETQTLQVTATSNNTALIPNPTVTYTSPNSTGSLSYTPVAYKYGSATITVTVRDAGLDGTLGTADDGTTSQAFAVTVNQVNQTPTLDAIANPAAINENAGLQTVNLSGITAGTGDSQTLQVTATSSNTTLIPNPTVTYTSPNATGSLSYTPVAYKYGTATITVTVRDAGLDGTLGSADDATFARTFTVTVNQVNQTPALDLIPDPPAIPQDAGVQTVGLTGISAGTGDTQSLQVSATSDNSTLIPNPTVSYTSPNTTGSLTYQPGAGRFGTAHVTVTVRDAGLDGTLGNADDGTFARTFAVVVTQVTQPPTLNPIANPTPINENSGLQTVNLSGITAGPGDSQTLQVTATSSNTALIPNPTVTYSSPNATGSLSYTPVAYKYGTATITVTVRDAGADGTLGNADDMTFAQSFTVTVNQVDQPPTLDAIADPTPINENSGLQTVNLSGITAGTGDNQTLQVSASSSNPTLIPTPVVSYASANTTGSLSYTPAVDQYGTATITVTVRDAGLDGTLGNADDGTFARSFSVVVNRVNKTPTLDALSDPAPIPQNAGVQTLHLTGISAGAGESQTLQVTASSDNPLLILNPTVSYTSPATTASLSYPPLAAKSGTAHITVTVRDAGLDGILGNADDGTFGRTFTVVVDQTVTVTLQPIRDNTLIKDTTKTLGTTSNGTGDVYTGRNSAGTVTQRGLLAFDVAGSIPTGAKIQSVALTMYVSKTAVGNTPVSLHAVTSNWGEAGSYGVGGTGGPAQTGDATWLNTFYDTQSWVTPGGDFNSTPSGTQIIGAQGASYTWTSTAALVADVQRWLDDPSANFGWLLQGDETQQSSKQLASREATTVGQRPQLTITYAINAPPTLDATPDPAALNENAGPQTLNLTGITAGGGDSQALQVTAVSDNPTLLPDPSVNYSSPAATASLSYQPMAYQFGTARVTVTVRDAGLDGTLGTADDGLFTRTFTVTVNEVNQAPTLDAIANPAAINADAGVQTVNLSGITAGPGDSQSLQVTAFSDNPTLIPQPTVTYTSPAATGSLSYQPVAGKAGVAQVTVTVRDTGLDGQFGTADDALVSRTFSVVVNQSGQSTPCLYNPTAANFFGRGNNSQGFADFGFGYGVPRSNWIPLTGDWNGDGQDGVGFYDPATSMFYLRDTLTSGPADYAFAFGVAGGNWVPVAGDWNGDGKDSIGCYAPTTSVFFLRNSVSTGMADLAFGFGPPAGDWTPLAGDWDGNGTDSIGLYNADRAVFYLRNANSTGFADAAFGFGTPDESQKPLVGDWNGDGVDSIGCYDVSSAHWYLRNSNSAGAADVHFGFGAPRSNWKPLTGNWGLTQGQSSAPGQSSTVPRAPLAAAASPALEEGLLTDLSEHSPDLAQVAPIDRDYNHEGDWRHNDVVMADEEEGADGHDDDGSGDSQLMAIDACVVDQLDLSAVLAPAFGHGRAWHSLSDGVGIANAVKIGAHR